ncbi:MAG: hypothetical protein VX278_23935 [Myxococcota bacterium]|nr:hypothetical protein [Myxococcota bacterium]
MTRKKRGMVVAKSFDSFFEALSLLGGRTRLANLERRGIERFSSV